MAGREDADMSAAGQETKADAEGEAPPKASDADAPAEGAAPAECEDKKDSGPSNEERVVQAEAAKEAGNTLLKAGDFAGAAAKYAEGIELTEPLLEKDSSELGEDLQKRGTVAYQALRLNSAQACIKMSSWTTAIEHAGKVLLLEKDNTKALYRRSLAAAQLDTEGRLDEARVDLVRLVALEPANREARELLVKVKERLKDLKQQEKERLSAAMKGGLYQEQHKKHGKLQAAYEEEVKRRKEAGEEEISFEDFAKKAKEKEEELEKKQKEDAKKRKEEEQLEEEKRQLALENARRAADGKAELSLEDWRAEVAKKAQEARKRAEEVVKMDEAELDEEDKKLLKETKEKGYYHGRLGTVLSDAAPKPQLVTDPSSPTSGAVAGSEWNQAGTWEEKDASSWAKERLSAWLSEALVSGSNVTLPDGSVGEVTAKVTKVKSLSGEAHIVYVRKQVRHGFNYEAETGFSITLGDEKLSGTLSLPDLNDVTAPAELQLKVKWKNSGPSEKVLPLANQWLERLCERVRGQVAAFRDEYQKRT